MKRMSNGLTLPMVLFTLGAGRASRQLYVTPIESITLKEIEHIHIEQEFRPYVASFV